MTWIEYRLWSTSDRHFDWKQAEEFASQLEDQIRNYFWFNDSLYFEPKCTSEGISFLYGKIYDELLEDEYYVVKLLLLLSSMHKDLAIQVQDSDGEFLLYEGADFIPKWITPSCQRNRVFIHRGMIHFIGKAIQSPSIKMILEVLREGKSEVSPKELYRSIARLCEKPQELHCSTCILPEAIANLLSCFPQCISLVIHSLKLMQEEEERPISFPFELTPTKIQTVTFTRSQFASLSRFPMPQSKELCKKYLPLLPHNNDSTTFPQAERGMKIALAFAYALAQAPTHSFKNSPNDYSCRQYFQSQFEYRSYEALKMLSESSKNPTNEQQLIEDDDSWLKTNVQEQENTLKSLFDNFTLSDEEILTEKESDEYITTSDECSFSEGEYEVLETIFNDPGLLQRIIEKNADSGADEDTRLLIQKLNILNKAKK